MPCLNPAWSSLYAVVCLAVVLPLPNNEARAGEEWTVVDRIAGENGKHSRDVSGIACKTSSGFPRHCLVIDDNLQSGQFVTLKDGELKPGDVVPLIENTFGGKALELDGEGVAFYSDPQAKEYPDAFYVIGSHGHARHSTTDCVGPLTDENKAKITAASQIVRVRLKPSVGKTLSMHDVVDITRNAKLRDFIAAEPKLQPFKDKCLEPNPQSKGNGVTIEGIAILGGRIYAGFRGPSLPGAPILSVPLDSLFGSGSGGARLDVVKLDEGRGVRDLAPYKDGLLVLAGPVGSAKDRYDVYWWDTSSPDMKHLGDITNQAQAAEQSKPEGILPLDVSSGRLRLLIVSDGKDAKDGAPRTVVVNAP
ncbi:MAG: DUF3616 domain-containing protein [Reyranella sp.]|nr:DUF3616 domain-containing protein [Reyranella sp.]